MFSGSKDNYLICQSLADAHHPFKTSSQVSHTISNSNVLAYISEFGIQSDTPLNYQTADALLDQIKLTSTQQTVKHLKLFNRNYTLLILVDEICSRFEEDNVFTSFQDELKYYCENYRTQGKVEEIVRHNQQVALDTKRPDIARLWGDFYRVLSHKEEDDSQEQDKSAMEKEIQESGVVDQQREEGSQGEFDQQKLFQYFEKNPILLKQEVEEKNIIYRNNCIYFMKTKMVEYQQLIRKMLTENQNDLKQDQDNQRDLIKQSLVDSLQAVIDKGQLQHAFTIYRVFQESGLSLNVDPQQLQLWSMAYIELLRNNKFYIQANQCIKFNSLDIIRNTNKKNTSIYFNVTCHKCLKTVDLDRQYQCPQCKTQALCAICQEPLNKGLLVWCQHCSHATHARETKQWFSENADCPTGCGHQCFQVMP